MMVGVSDMIAGAQGAMNNAVNNAAQGAMSTAGTVGMWMTREMAEDYLKSPLFDSKSPEKWGTDPGLEKSLKIAAPLTVYEVDRFVGKCDNEQLVRRSYLWIGENRIEENVAVNVGAAFGCAACCETTDMVKVSYFDKMEGIRPPVASCGCTPKPAPIEVLEDNFMCCKTKLCTIAEMWATIFPCFCHPGVKIVYVPQPNCCLGICPNRSNWCTNCCGNCGLQDGTPFLYVPVIDGIKDVHEGDRACAHLNAAASAYGKKRGWEERVVAPRVQREK